MEQEPSEGQVKELQAFMETENQKAVIQAAISKLTDICFEKCITKPGSKLDSSEANCVANCAGRFLDSSVFVVNRMMQKGKGHNNQADSGAAPCDRAASLTRGAAVVAWAGRGVWARELPRAVRSRRAISSAPLRDGALLASSAHPCAALVIVSAAGGALAGEVVASNDF
eukprot:CAMPEP_0118829948 /NCGR_PEP_ID=MMETSP1162-20130426/25374_1 /TAXON_ID=33656 /ORGANISM="Phaeocystis Sp, Strain CCMP2710" /LENGTH=169 /DNA_ID=CAMNT_0006761201 /DNA_START=38 /DNA_END=548 /DNA_ORIENTATION=+